MLQLVYRPASLDDLDAIFDFVGADSPSRAMTFVEDIRAHCRMLCAHPQLGPSRPDIGVDVSRYVPLPGRTRVYPSKGPKRDIGFLTTY